MKDAVLVTSFHRRERFEADAIALDDDLRQRCGDVARARTPKLGGESCASGRENARRLGKALGNASEPRTGIELYEPERSRHRRVASKTATGFERVRVPETNVELEVLIHYGGGYRRVRQSGAAEIQRSAFGGEIDDRRIDVARESGLGVEPAGQLEAENVAPVEWELASR